MAKEEKARFELHGKAKRKDFVGVLINGENVNLVGKAVTKQIKATKNSPARELKYRAGTPEDLKAYYELGAHGEGSNQKIVIKVGRELPSDSGSV
jgi:hypothetical protein